MKIEDAITGNQKVGLICYRRNGRLILGLLFELKILDQLSILLFIFGRHAE